MNRLRVQFFRPKLIGIVLAILFGGLFWFLRAWWHGLVILLYTQPVLWEAMLVWLALHLLAFRRLRGEASWQFTDNKGRKSRMRWRHAWWSYPLLAALLAMGIPAASIARQVQIVRQVEYHSLAKLPEAVENVRLMPSTVAYRYARDALQLSQYKLGTQHVALINGRLAWTFPLVPDGLVLAFLAKNKGMTYVDATTQERNSRMVWREMAVGEGMQVSDNLWWNLYRRRYFISTEDPYYIPAGGEVYTVVPAIAYRFAFRWGILYTVPYYAGTFLVDTAGNIRFLTPDQAREHPLLANNLIYPERLSRMYVGAYQYKGGVLNRFFVHADQIQIQDVQGNEQPFLMDTDDGLKWFLSTEPYGESHGVFKIFLVDAQTGMIDLYELPEDEVLTGPIRAMDYVRQSNPLVDWSQFQMVEPLPFIRDGVLYWKAAVIPVDAAGIAYQAFVDSRNNQVVEVRSSQEVQQFIAGKLPAPSGTAPVADLVQLIRERLSEMEGLVQQLEQSLKER